MKAQQLLAILPKAMRMGPVSRQRSRFLHTVVAMLLALASAAGCLAQDTSPARFPLTDRGPLNGLLGIPEGWTSVQGTTGELSWLITSNAMGQESGTESLLLDGETHTLSLRWQQQLGDRLALGLYLPWIAHSGGFLDRSIDAWHDAFGLSDGIRPELPTDDLRYVYLRNGETSADVTSPRSGIGDIRTSAAWRLAGGLPGNAVLDLTADIKWPTGDAGRLTGSGSTDLATGLRAGRAAPFHAGGGSRLGWSGQAGVVWPGDVDEPLPPPAGQIYYYDAALAWAASQSLDAVVQLNGHSAAWQSDLKMTGQEALQLAAGILWRFTDDYGMRLAILEDIRADTTPDLGIELAITWKPGGGSLPAGGPLDPQ